MFRKRGNPPIVPAVGKHCCQSVDFVLTNQQSSPVGAGIHLPGCSSVGSRRIYPVHTGIYIFYRLPGSRAGDLPRTHGDLHFLSLAWKSGLRFTPYARGYTGCGTRSPNHCHVRLIHTGIHLKRRTNWPTAVRPVHAGIHLSELRTRSPFLCAPYTRGYTSLCQKHGRRHLARPVHTGIHLRRLVAGGRQRSAPRTHGDPPALTSSHAAQV